VDAVMNEASSLARNATAAAISDASANRPIGTWTSRRAARSGSAANSSVSSGVLTGPGHSALTRIPSRPRAHPALGRGVRDLRGGRAQDGDERRRVDDRPLALPLHVRDGLAAAQVDRGEVDLLHPPPRLEAGRQDRVVLGRRDARVVEGDVDGPVGLHGDSESPRHILGDGHVGLDEHTARLVRGLVARRHVDVHRHDVRALVGQPPHRRQPDAAAGARHDSRASLKPSVHQPPLARPDPLDPLEVTAQLPVRHRRAVRL
jgi:hypothetical protein